MPAVDFDFVGIAPGYFECNYQHSYAISKAHCGVTVYDLSAELVLVPLFVGAMRDGRVRVTPLMLAVL